MNRDTDRVQLPDPAETAVSYVALRRLGELTARGASAAEVLQAVAGEAARLSDADVATLLRYDADGSTEIVALDGAPAGVTLGMRAPGPGDGAAQRLWRTGRPARVDDLANASGHWPRGAPAAGFAASLAVPFRMEGTLWGALVVASREHPLAHGVEDQLVTFAELAVPAVAAADARLQLRARSNEQAALRRVAELSEVVERATRARIIASADEARERLQRDVHDGPQQRLVHAVIALKMARTAVEAGSEVAELVAEALANVERASRELRDVVHAVLPRSLGYGGLSTGLRSLVADLSLPVDVKVAVPRLPKAVETTAYLVVAEALTNAVKHARARMMHLDVGLEGETLVVEIRDDGVGNADSGLGTGMVNVFDRVDAAGGSLTVVSPAGQGTTVRVELPVRLGNGW